MRHSFGQAVDLQGVRAFRQFDLLPQAGGGETRALVSQGSARWDLVRRFYLGRFSIAGYTKKQRYAAVFLCAYFGERDPLFLGITGTCL
jgi:hypothetical protein